MKRGLVHFLLGIVVGLVASLLLPRLLPVSWRLALGSVEGTVEAELLDEGRLLLTLATPRGLVLASFEEDVARIDLLVELGDRVTLAARGYQPFLEDPVIARVERPAALVPGEAASDRAERPASEAKEDEAEVDHEADGADEPLSVGEEDDREPTAPEGNSQPAEPGAT